MFLSQHRGFGRSVLVRVLPTTIAMLLAGCQDDGGGEPSQEPSAELAAPLVGEYIDRQRFANPMAHIPAQCYIETAGGRQNACLFCHSNGLFDRGLGNNNPQAGRYPIVGDLQQEYAFGANQHPLYVNGSVNPWENTLSPEVLRSAVLAMGERPQDWDIQAWIRQDNWQDAFARRPGSPLDWDPGVSGAGMRLLPGLSPADLPADDDGFVRSGSAERGFFEAGGGWITGWRAINFMPYGIFTPHAGSVSGIYIRLPVDFMRTADGTFSLETYEQNLDLLARAIQDRLLPDDPVSYLGAASGTPVERGLYPLGTEFAHPLHYVDMQADGRPDAPSRYPGTRAERVKEVRYMYKFQPFDPGGVPPGNKAEDAPVYASSDEGWIDNGAGWILAGYIEDGQGSLRAQTPAELTQCVGCHSGNTRDPERQYERFTSGVGTTVDSTWAFPRQLPGDAGWAEMDYLGFIADRSGESPGVATRATPRNRVDGRGEFQLFLEHVVGASLYGDMPESMDRFMASTATQANGYSADWVAVDTTSPASYAQSMATRQTLMREMTARGEHLDENGAPRAPLFYPTEDESLAAARRYRQVVVTQRYELGKDVFAETPVTLRYLRSPEDAFAHQDGTPYELGERITDRPIDTRPTSFTYGVGIGDTLIEPDLPFAEGGTYLPDYTPLIE